MNLNNKLFKHIKNELTFCQLDEKLVSFLEDIANLIAKHNLFNIEADKAFSLLQNSVDDKAWTPIGLNDEEFNATSGYHKRTWFIQKNDKGIFNTMAYLLHIRRCYIVEKENQINEIKEGILDKKGEYVDEKIYISRGGIINGDYIHKCYLKHQEGPYVVRDSIKVPVSTIEFSDSPDVIFFVDHREPKIKALMEFYNVSIEHDDNIKFNVRTFNKLK